MNEKENFDEVGQESMSDSAACSSSDSQNADCCSSSSGSLRKGLKTFIFVGVILLACGVVAHSLLTKSDATAGETDDAAVVTECFILPEVDGPLAEVSTTNKEPVKTASVSCGVTLDSVRSLAKLAAEKKANVVFILLPGEDQEQTMAASSQIEKVLNILSVRKKRVAAFTLEKSAEGYDEVVKQFSVKSFPCVIVSGRGCGSVAVWDQITEANLLGAFVKASIPVSSCGPGSSPSCCPK